MDDDKHPTLAGQVAAYTYKQLRDYKDGKRNNRRMQEAVQRLSDEQLAELFITGTVTRGQSDEVTVTKSTDHKCGRCWRLLPEVSEDGELCNRCESDVGE